MGFTMLIYTLAIVVGSMHTFLCIFGYFVPVVTVLMVIGELKRLPVEEKKDPNEPKPKCKFSLSAIAKIANIALIAIAFFNVFFDDLVFAGGMPTTTDEEPTTEEGDTTEAGAE